MSLQDLLGMLGPEIEDPEEEVFLLFSQTIPSQNLGFVDSRAVSLDLTIGDRDLTIHQSPTLLSSNRKDGTTGAVVWKITPLLASWITSSSNILFKLNILHSKAAALELGCGISGIIGLVLGPHIGSYVLTDQDYVMKLLNQNLSMNMLKPAINPSKGRKSAAKKGSAGANNTQKAANVVAKVLNWETDQVSSSLTSDEGNGGFDVVIACDCIYNDALIRPLVQTSIDVCKLKSMDQSGVKATPTVCLVAQQLRSPEVFGAWLEAFTKDFRVWRVPDEHLVDDLRSNSGFVIHLGVLR